MPLPIRQAIVDTVATGGRVEPVIDLVAEAELEPAERVALLLDLLASPAEPGRPHPADLVVCAYVSLGYPEYARTAARMIDLR